jgi:cytochrome d ubiquinol oxidase subunit I
MAGHGVLGAVAAGSPPAGVSFWGAQLIIAILFIVHGFSAYFLTGANFVAVAAEGTYYFTNNERWDRIAHNIARLQALVFAPGSFVPIITILALSALWPLFWGTIVRITFWPFVIEALSFILWVLYLYTWYYTWEVMKPYKLLHISFGMLFMFSSWLQQVMIDVTGSYMLTPTDPTSLQAIVFNPTFIPLDLHRTIGNISDAGFVLAGYAAWRYLRARSLEDRAFFDMFGSVGLIFGIGFLFIQPFIGFQYALSIDEHAPAALYRVMSGGPRSFLFLIQVVLLSGLFVLGSFYAYLQLRKSSARRTAFVTGLMLALVGWCVLLCLPPHWSPHVGPIDLSWLGRYGLMNPWKYVALAGLTLTGMIVFFVYLSAIQRGFKWGARGVAAQVLLIVLAFNVSAIAVDMGIIREEARRPFLIYGRMYIEPQAPGEIPANGEWGPTHNVQVVPVTAPPARPSGR